MVGDSLLVANVVEKGATTRRIYLPRNERFYDFYTREAYEGGQTIEIPVTLSSIPLFIRAGAIIPMALNQMSNLAERRLKASASYAPRTVTAHLPCMKMTGITENYKKG